MSHTNTSTGIRISTAPDGQRTVAIRTATTVRTGPDFREQLDRACRPATPTAGSGTPVPTTPASPTTPVATGPAATAAPTAATPCNDVAQLRDQLRELIQQLIALLERQGQGHGCGRVPPPRLPTQPPGAGTESPASTNSATPTASVPPPTSSASSACVSVPMRVFDVRPVGDPAGAATGHVVVRGGMAGAPVTTGAKLDEGIRRISSFLQQIERHVEAGGTFTDAQLQSIADETIGIYYEAIRPTTGDGDGGDYSSTARDGILDVGASTRSISVQATVHAAASTAQEPVAA